MNCKTWKWAVYAYSAARILGITCNNFLGPFDTSFMLCDNDGSRDAVETEPRPMLELPSLYDSIWSTLCRSCEALSVDNYWRWRNDEFGLEDCKLVQQWLQRLKSQYSEAIGVRLGRDEGTAVNRPPCRDLRGAARSEAPGTPERTSSDSGTSLDWS